MLKKESREMKTSLRCFLKLRESSNLKQLSAGRRYSYRTGEYACYSSSTNTMKTYDNYDTIQLLPESSERGDVIQRSPLWRTLTEDASDNKTPYP